MYPALQNAEAFWQSATDVLATGEVKPAGHAVQDASALCWVSVPYLPAAQFVQYLAPSAVASSPAGHVRHVAMLVAPKLGEYMPAAHSVQSAALLPEALM